FYKIFYHLLFQSVRRLALEEDGSNVLILLDDKTNRYPFRLPVLKKALNAGLKRDLKLGNLVANVEPRQSSGPNAEPLIQIVDVLIGALATCATATRSAWKRRRRKWKWSSFLKRWPGRDLRSTRRRARRLICGRST